MRPNAPPRLLLLLAALQVGCGEMVDRVLSDARSELAPDASDGALESEGLTPEDAGADVGTDASDAPATEVLSDAPADVRADALPEAAADAGPFVRIVAPPAGATQPSPVAFQIAAGGVATVRLFTDDFPMAAAWDPATRDNLVYRFSGPDRAHLVVLRGYDGAGSEQARDQLQLTVTGTGEAGSGTAGATFYNTYYYLALEADYAPPDDTTLYDGACTPLAMVPARFSDSICVEGSGRLRDGRVLNYSSSCTCGRRCPTGGTVCYSVLDPRRYPWGVGVASRALVPLRSWATDRSVLATGTLVYVPRWDGVAIPSIDGLGGFLHDGCFRADDTGGAITGNHVDIFAGSPNLWRALERLVPTRTNFPIQLGATRCAYLGR